MDGFLYVYGGIKWHRSDQFKQWCDRHNIDLGDWPDYSPDFNAIELIWNIIKQKIKNKNPKSQDELENAADEALNLYNLANHLIQYYIGHTIA